MTPGQVKDWIDVIVRILAILAIGLVLTFPGIVPLLHYFLVTHGEVNVFGQKFEFSQTSALAPGLEIKDGKLFLAQKDITTYPDMVARLQTANDELTVANKQLATQISDTAKLLEEVKKQRDAANGQLANLQASTPAAKPIQTEALDSQVNQQLKQNQKQIAKSTTAVPVLAAGPSAAVLLFGVVFSSDTTADEAAYEVKKAHELFTSYAIATVKRGRFIASMAVFPTREAAAAALPNFQKEARWRGPYIVDFRTWCPAALTATFSNDAPTAGIDCGF
jgi:hypothetical protein